MGDKLLSAVGLGKAEASPAVLAPQLMGAQAGAGVLLKRDAENQNNLDWPDERWNTSTVSKPALDLSLRSLLGRNPDDKEVEESGYHYPVTRSRTRKTETLVEQEGRAPLLRVLPIVHPLLFSGLYFKKRWTVEARLIEAELPMEGDVQYEPTKGYKPSMPLPKGPYRIGYYDNLGNVWKKGPSRTAGEDFEWDVQLSKRGKVKYAAVSKGRNHLNVSLKGKITH